jgi:hypothetical protein
MREAKYNSFGRFGKQSLDYLQFVFLEPAQDKTARILSIGRRPDSQTKPGKFLGPEGLDYRAQPLVTAF